MVNTDIDRLTGSSDREQSAVIIEFVDGVIAFGKVDCVVLDRVEFVVTLDPYVTGKGSNIPAKKWLIGAERQTIAQAELKVRKRLPM